MTLILAYIDRQCAIFFTVSMNTTHTFVIGGGAAGFFSAIHTKLAHPKRTVVILEKSSDLLSKVKLSGGGRCNVTHACFDPKDLCEFYPRGAQELRGPFHTFQPQDTMDWFESRGVPLKIESDGRVFPVSDRASDISDCLLKTASDLDIKIWTGCTVTTLTRHTTGFDLSFSDGQTLHAEKVVLATGSNRSGYALAAALGHRIETPVPSLFTFMIPDKRLHLLSGLSVPTVEAWLSHAPKKTQKGPLLITHWGLSGPCVIKLSAWQARDLYESGYKASLCIRFLSHLEIDDIRERLLYFQAHNARKKIVTQSPFPEIPQRLWAYLLERLHMNDQQTWEHLNPTHLTALTSELNVSTYPISGKGVFKEEFVTCGGVSLKEVNFKTMESKACPGLYIIGELLNIDGVTGGFNFQNAWTTGYLSGQG